MPFYFARGPEPEAEAQPTGGEQSDLTSIQSNGSSSARGSSSQGNGNNGKNSSDNRDRRPLIVSSVLRGAAVDGVVSSYDSARSQTIAPQPGPEPETDNDNDGKEGAKAPIHLQINPRSVNSLSSLSRYLKSLLKFHRQQQRRANSRKSNHNPDPAPAPSSSRSGEEPSIYLTPFTEGVLKNFTKLIAEKSYTEEDVPLIMNDISTMFLPEGSKWAASIRKLQEMQLEWFDLRFGEYVGLAGLSAESHARREHLGRHTGRKDAIFVDGVWSDHPPEPLDWKPTPSSKSAGKLPATGPLDCDFESQHQSTKKPQTPTIQFAQALFDRSSWETINSILEREELEETSMSRQMAKQEGPMTTLLRLLAYHTNDTLPNVRSVISDYVARRHPSHLQSQLSLKDLVLKGHYYGFAGRLAADLGMVDHLPQAIDKRWQALLLDKMKRIIVYHFERFDVHSITGALLTYTPRRPGEYPQPPGPYWRVMPPRSPAGQFDISAEEEIDAVTGGFHELRGPLSGAPNIWQIPRGPDISEQLRTGSRIHRGYRYNTRGRIIRPPWPVWPPRQPTTPLQSSARPVLGSQESTPRPPPEREVASRSQQSTPKQLHKEAMRPQEQRSEATGKGKDPENGK